MNLGLFACDMPNKALVSYQSNSFASSTEFGSGLTWLGYYIEGESSNEGQNRAKARQNMTSEQKNVKRSYKPTALLSNAYARALGVYLLA
jgi:hypothetical protein